MIGEWAQMAACRENPDLMFPKGSFPYARATKTAVEEAKAVCAGCPVLEQCRAYTARVRPTYGVWAGEFFQDKNRSAGTSWAPAAACGTLAGHRVHYRRGEKPCGRCRDAHMLAKSVR